MYYTLCYSNTYITVRKVAARSATITKSKQMKVYKFGGASVKDAEGVKNVVDIINSIDERVFVIISAMGKTTNALEGVLESFYSDHKDEALAKLQAVMDSHNKILTNLYGYPYIPKKVLFYYQELENIISVNDPANRRYEMWYDLIVSYGELLSTAIISDYMRSRELSNRWIDMRTCFVTNNRYKDANIDIATSAERLLKVVNSSTEPVLIGQGFIGATLEGVTTTIGREGSDYSAAVAGAILNAASVSIWKDVEGILNGDPKFFKDVKYIPEMTYVDAIELAYSGAQIIHPKTIKPLQNKNIPLYVKCFLDKNKPGSVIKQSIDKPINVPIYILKHNQLLLTIAPKDLSFVLEEKFVEIFSLLEKYHVKTNLIQSSAVNLSLCVDSTRYISDIVREFDEAGYIISYETDMELLTIRGYANNEQTEKMEESGNTYLTQRTKRIMRLVRKKQGA